MHSEARAGTSNPILSVSQRTTSVVPAAPGALHGDPAAPVAAAGPAPRVGASCLGGGPGARRPHKQASGICSSLETASEPASL